MALIQIRQCDRPGCETRIPDGGKRYLLNALVIGEQGSVQHEADAKGEYCSPSCIVAVVNGLLNEVQGVSRLSMPA